MSLAPRLRMSAQQRRLQLLDIGLKLFAARGLENTTIDEIGAAAGVSKPVIYEHFESKDGLYRKVVERQSQRLLQAMAGSLIPQENSAGSQPPSPRYLVERAVLTLLTFIESDADAFRILLRDSAPAEPGGTLALLSGRIVEQVQQVLGEEFARRGFQPADSVVYAQMLVGMVSRTGQWWMDVREPAKEVVAAQVVNLIWYGMTGLRPDPQLTTGD